MADNPYSVVIDSNIWVAERLLQTAIGNALLYSLTGSAGKIVLPEIVEREVTATLLTQGEKAVSEISRAVRLLRQLSGHSLKYTAPTEAAMTTGIAERWAQLDGLLERVPFTFDHATGALQRIYKAIAPCGPNNEQFRDCCIWEVAIAKAKIQPVHLVTGDLAFYEGRDPKKGLAKVLQEELMAGGLDVKLHSTLGSFLEAIQAIGPKLDPHQLSLAIIPAVRPIAAEKASKNHPGEAFELVLRSEPSIKSYATPSASTIAVTFEVRYWLRRTSIGEDKVSHEETAFNVEGTCSYEPSTKSVSDVRVEGWSEFLRSAGGMSRGTFNNPDVRRQYAPGQQRDIG